MAALARVASQAVRTPMPRAMVGMARMAPRPARAAAVAAPAQFPFNKVLAVGPEDLAPEGLPAELERSPRRITGVMVHTAPRSVRVVAAAGAPLVASSVRALVILVIRSMAAAVMAVMAPSAAAAVAVAQGA